MSVVQIIKMQCNLCKNMLLVKKEDVGDRFKYELRCPICGWYKVWFEEKPVERKKSVTRGKKKAE